MRFTELNLIDEITEGTQQQFFLVSVLTPVTGQRISFNDLRNELLITRPIDHSQISGSGTKTHTQIDDHLNSTALHIRKTVTWIDLTIVSPWQAFNVDLAPKITKTRDNVVSIRGLVKGGTPGTTYKVCNVGEMFLPDYDINYVAWAEDVACRLIIRTDGDLFIADVASGKAYYSLSTIYHTSALSIFEEE